MEQVISENVYVIFLGFINDALFQSNLKSLNVFHTIQLYDDEKSLLNM